MSLEHGDSYSVYPHKNSGYNCYILTHEKDDLWTCGMYNEWMQERLPNKHGYPKIDYSYKHKDGYMEIGFYYDGTDIKEAKHVISVYSQILKSEGRLAHFDDLNDGLNTPTDSHHF